MTSVRFHVFEKSYAASPGQNIFMGLVSFV